ncbi:MAG TPA: hypothetical protein VNK96_09305 [Fimbriimonadales bacterium]|nr:hypothetical protein [Fimbriimonadales bacterium]
MSKPTPSTPTLSYRYDWFSTVLEWGSSKFLTIGIILTLICTVGLIYYVNHFSNIYLNPTSEQELKIIKEGETYIRYLQIGLIVGLVLFGLGMTSLFWGDIALPLILFLVAIVYFLADEWVPALGVSYRETSPSAYALASGAMGSLTLGGLVLGIGAILVQIADVAARMRLRAIYGAKGDVIKYGAGVREESDYRNVFMGKCWQLPFCRKFIREKCPIYHSRRTCWKERVGCMCEEDVIRNAMAGQTIPREAVAAAKFIPYNTRLTPEQKAERCRQCVIYNEHQRHKYKLMLWATMGLTGFIYTIFHTPLLESTNKLLIDFDQAMHRFTFSTQVPGGTQIANVSTSPDLLTEIVLLGFVLLVMAQVLKVVEFCVFKLKI